MSRHLALSLALLLGVTAVALLLALPMRAKARPIPLADLQTVASGRALTGHQVAQADSSILLSEDFEHEGAFPPTGWEVYAVISGWIAYEDPIGDPAHGWMAYVPAVANVNEILVSPDLGVYGRPARVTFWGKHPFFTPTSPTPTLTVWVVLGALDFVDDVELVTNAIADMPTTGWTQLSYDIPADYTGTIRLAWQYASARAYEFRMDDILVEVKQPEFVPPYSYAGAPYKVEPGDAMTYVLVVSNTGELTATSALVRDVLPGGVSHVAGTASWAPLGGGAVSDTVTDTATTVEWAGYIPIGAGVRLTIPVQVTGSAGDVISNVVTVDDRDIVDPFTLVAQTRVYPAGTLVSYTSFNAGPSGWQGGGDWEWGQPLQPLDAPHSWPSAWGTDLGRGTNGNYDRGVVHVLTGSLDLTGHPLTDTYLLQWWESFETTGLDAGLVQINGTTVYQVNLDRPEWTERLVNISDYAGQAVSVTFVLTTFATGESDTGGWYVDDVALHVLPPTASFDGSWKRVDRTKVAPGGRLTYTLYLTNSGHAASTQGHMLDALPAGLQVSDVISSGPGDVTFGADFVEWRTSASNPMPVGADATLTVVATVSPAVACGTTLLNSAVVSEATGYEEVYLDAPQVDVHAGDLWYASPFDADNGGLSASGVWTWGAAQNYGDGPAWDDQPAHTVPNVWGTNLAGDVADSSPSTHTLTLSTDLTAAGQLPLYLQWWDWFEPGDASHAGAVLISSAAHPTPTEVYRVQGDQGAGWVHHSLEVNRWAGQSGVSVQFVYSTDGDGVTGPGWYIDSLALHDGCPRLVLTPATETGAGCRGLEALYALDVFNWDRTPTQVDLGLSGNNWSTVVTPSVLTVPAATTSTVVVSVSVPSFGGDVDAVLLTAVADNGLTATARITTHATITTHWQPMAPLPERRAFHAVVALDSALYAIGGARDAAGKQPVTTTYRYDPSTDSWTARAGLPVPLSHIDAVAMNGEIFVPGGQTSGGAYVNTTYVYSPTADSWRSIPANPAQISPTVGYAAVAYGGYVVRLGGYLSPTRVTSEVWGLDAVAGTWSALPPLPTPRADLMAGVSQGAILVAGGFDGAAYLTSTLMYTASAWSAVDPLPTSPSLDRWVGAGDGMLGGAFYLVGGQRAPGALDHTAHYSLTTGSWTVTPELPKLRQPRQDLEADAVGGTIYAVGGQDGVRAWATNERLVFCPVCNSLSSVAINTPEFQPYPGEDIPVDGQVVTFTAAYEPALASSPIDWVWNWDDGSPLGSGHPATHVFYGTDPNRSSPESFLVVVTATNCGGFVRGERWVDVHSVPVYSMSLDANDPVSALPGSTASRVVNVYNLGNRWDSYTVTLSPADPPWTTTLILPVGGVLHNLAPSDVNPGTILAQVQVPPDANRGDSDSFTVMVASHGDKSLVRQVTLTTVYPDDVFPLYLPLVIKQGQ